MCPSYRVTHEEDHSTRGRAHLLWEMTQSRRREDAVIRDGWRSEEVKESLDLCLACKGCKSDCPVGVDVATYKAEFLSHYYEGRLRPRSAYAFGNIDLWARLASHAPGLVNLTTQLPFLRDIAKIVAGIPHAARHPRLRPRNFQTLVPPHARITRVAADAFVRPATRSERRMQAARWDRLSTAPGFAIAETPAAPWKSGPSGPRQRDEKNRGFSPRRPPLARHLQQLLPPRHRPRRRRSPRSRRIPRPPPASQPLLRPPPLRLRHARPRPIPPPQHPRRTRPRNRSRNPRHRTRAQLRRRLPRRTPQPLPPRPPRPSPEQTNFPAQRIPGTRTRTPNAPLPQLNRKALLHGHCHHKSIMKMTAEESLLRRLGIDFQSPAPGCCGMAGSFGFEHDKYEISMAIGELELLPAVRQAPADWLIIADGFSCREQIAQGTNRQALHLAEVLQMALESASAPYALSFRPKPERKRRRSGGTCCWPLPRIQPRPPARGRSPLLDDTRRTGPRSPSRRRFLLWQFTRNR